ncbi:MAG: SWIM zinc finger family protein [Acidobacteriaceae bacterium]|nr:SWIM zinc finger family protein [Acidobacteriaceae bacterium]
MALSLEKLEALAPDQASLNAARKLLNPAQWPLLATDTQGLLWGECRGSGATPYRVVLAEADAGYKCSCPSRKFPCKHALALMWIRAEDKLSFTPADAPDWVKDWVSRRRGGGAKTSADENKAKVSIAASSETDVAEADPFADARAAAIREKNRRAREASILSGLAELDTWLLDQVDRGMAAFTSQCTQACKLIAQRLVDAKAPGLATRIENLPATLFALPETMRELAAVEELGQLYLITEAYRRQKSLPPELRMDIRRAVGWTTTREELLADATAPRLRAPWRVIAVIMEVQPDRLRRIETWLWCEDKEATPRFALLLDFVPVATGAAVGGYSVGDRFGAELVFYPSATPLRALIAETSSGTQMSSSKLDMPDVSVEKALDTYETILGAQPWIGSWPITFRNGRVRRSGNALFVTDANGGATTALPLRSSQWDAATPLTGMKQLDGVGLWDGRRLTLCWAETELGRWINA